MIILYPYENVIQYKINNQIKEFIMPKKAMKYGKITNIPIFEKELGTLIKKEGWVTLLKSKKITLILPLHYTELDKEIFTVLLNNNGIKTVKYKKEISLLELEKNKIFINIHETYATLVKKEKNKIILFYPLNIFTSLDDFLSFVTKNKKQIFIYGSNENIKENIVKKKHMNIFYYNNLKTFIITKYIP